MSVPHSRRLAAVGAAVVGDQRLRQPQLAAAAAASNGGIVELEQGAADSVVTAVIDGSPFVTYCYGSDLSRPFLFPLRGPNGGPVITRPHQPDDGEHPHQKGVWCAVDEVNGIRFWGERQIPDNVERWPQGKIESRGVVLRGRGTAAATLELSSEWLGEGGTAVLHEHTALTIHASHLLEYTVTLTAPDDRDVIFGDTKEGFFGIRLVDELRASEGATVVNSDGVVGCDACYGRHADWIDYSGPVGSVQGDLRASRAVQDLTSDWQPVTVGVAIFDHPSNFRRAFYHVRDYGLFTVSPFGEAAYTTATEQREASPVVIERGGALTLRYAMLVHDGDAAEADVAAHYAQYAAT